MEQIFRIKITLPGGVIKEFNTDDYNEDKTIDRFIELHGKSNVKVERIYLKERSPRYNS